MLRALSLSPIDTFSRELLYAEPAALGAWIRYRFARWLLTSPMHQTEWFYGERGRGPHGEVIVGSPAAAKLEIWSGNQMIEMEYRFPHLGAEVGMPLPYSVLESLPSIQPSTHVYMAREGQKSGDGATSILELIGTKVCAVVNVRVLLDSFLTRRGLGTVGAMMLLGVTPELRADLARLSLYTRRLEELATTPATRTTRYTPGTPHTEWMPVDRAAIGGVDLRAIREDTEQIFAQHAFRGAIFMGELRGVAGSTAVTYMGEIVNVPDDDKGAMPKPQSMINKAVDFALDQVGKDPREIRQAVEQQAASIVKDNLGIKNAAVNKGLDFAIGEIGKGKGEIKGDLIGAANSAVVGKITQNPIAAKGVLAGLAALEQHNPKVFEQMVVQDAQGAAIVKLKDVGKTVLGPAGERIHVPGGVTDFLVNHAEAVAAKDYKSLVGAAITEKLPGGAVAHQAAAIVLEKVTGQPVTSHALQALGAQALKGMIDRGPVVATGKAGDAAVTGVGKNAAGADVVTLHDGTSASTIPHSQLQQDYDTVATPGDY